MRYWGKPLDADTAAVIRRYAEALNATNVALKAAIAELDSLKVRMDCVEHHEYRNAERVTILEAARFRAEAQFLPPAEKMN